MFSESATSDSSSKAYEYCNAHRNSSVHKLDARIMYVKYSINTRVYVPFLRYDVPVGFCSFDLSIQGRSVLSNDVCFCFWTVSLTEEIGFDGS